MNYFFRIIKVISVAGINTELISPKLKSFILSKEEELINRINDFKVYYSNTMLRKKNWILIYPSDQEVTSKIFSSKYLPLVNIIINKFGAEGVSNMLLSYFMSIVTKETTNLEKSEVETPGIPSIRAYDDFGRRIFNKYIYWIYLESEVRKNGGSFSQYEELIKKDYSNIYEVDGSYSMLGGYLVWSLVTVDLLVQSLDKNPEDTKEHMYYLRISDKARKLLVKGEIKITHLPQKLPMVVTPKPYSKDVLGGYLLNDVKFNDNIIIEKKGYKIPSVIFNNDLYNMVNNMSATPFKINTVLLDFILDENNNKKFNLLLDSKKPHPFEELEVKTRYHKSVIKSYNSKVVLQEIILEIVSFFKNFKKIYFPVRLDNRGRIYCSPSYFNYQSNELSRSLLLFSNPSIITRNDMECFTYLKLYGVNCYGNKISKMSNNSKLKWIDDNIDDILNYGQSSLLEKAKDKLLFLAFCIEFKRFYEFYIDENQMTFSTYLPIQLDATCNGFQHMALLSNEESLFKELNLQVSQKDGPKDFYNFLVQRKKIFYLFLITLKSSYVISFLLVFLPFP
jgi:hypothetical protein